MSAGGLPQRGGLREGRQRFYKSLFVPFQSSWFCSDRDTSLPTFPAPICPKHTHTMWSSHGPLLSGMLGKSFPSGGASWDQGWVAIAGSLSVLLATPPGKMRLRSACFHPWVFPVAPRTLHLPYFPLILKRMMAMNTSETRRRTPRMMQGMRSISSRGSQSFVFTITEDSGRKNPKSGRKRNGHGLLLVYLTSPSSLHLTHFPFGPLLFLPFFFFFPIFPSAFRCLVYRVCSVMSDSL